jgi:hypothetical protein
MTQFGFGTLALLVVVGLIGPMLASVPRLRVPSVVGELLVGIVLGKTGLGVIDHTDPTFELLSERTCPSATAPCARRRLRPWYGPSWSVRSQQFSAWDSRRSSTPGTPPSMEF